MNYREFSKIMEKFDEIIERCLKCTNNPTCSMHKISGYVQEIGKTAFLAELKEIGLEGIKKKLNIIEIPLCQKCEKNFNNSCLRKNKLK